MLSTNIFNSNLEIKLLATRPQLSTGTLTDPEHTNTRNDKLLDITNIWFNGAITDPRQTNPRHDKP